MSSSCKREKGKEKEQVKRQSRGLRGKEEEVKRWLRGSKEISKGSEEIVKRQ